MSHKTEAYSLDHAGLLESLAATDQLLIIQDLDGVCMSLVRDPLRRRIERRYVEAARTLSGHFYVLTNGEHIGNRGVNGIVEQVFDPPEHPRDQGFYLPGLAAGGVQLQDRYGRVSHPGVSEAELDFLRAVPHQTEQFLRTLLGRPPYALPASEIETLVSACVLDNLASPTANINGLYHHFADRPGLYRRTQEAMAGFMSELLRQAAEAGLGDSFFIHYAPNLGRGDDGRERVKYSDGDDAGTTDFQFMLKGAIKEVGVLVILNHYYRHHTGRYPLGEHFNARQAPRDHAALLKLAQDHFDPAAMPRIVGVGDTVSSHAQELAGRTAHWRGGSDRGFLTLVQQLGDRFDTDNVVIYIDSSCGEVRRPSIGAALLRNRDADPDRFPWPALQGISDPDDPLKLDAIFPGGHAQYVDFFCELAQRRGRREMLA